MPELVGHLVPDNVRSATRVFEWYWASGPRRKLNKSRAVEQAVGRDMALLSTLHDAGLIEWVGDRKVDAT